MRVLAAIASYGTGNDQYLKQLVDEYKGMSCDVDVLVLSNIQKAVASGVEVIAVDLNGVDPWSLPFAHKQIFADRLEQYDVFIYSEDDTLLRENNIQAFLEVSETLPDGEIPGFLRFERTPEGGFNYPEVHGHFHWDPSSVRSRGPYTLACFSNEHSACYALTQRQLRQAIVSGGFLVAPHKGKYDLLCTAATDPYTQCGFKKLLCISHLDDFLIHHLPNKYIGTSFGVNNCELRRQLNVLSNIGATDCPVVSLLQTETKLTDARFSKSYYEEVHPAVVAAIPAEAQTLLSIGCGWGAMEAFFAKKGLHVTAVPLDPVIPGGAEANGVEIVNGTIGEVQTKLDGRKFDCLLLSNVLHLFSDAAAPLATFGALLAAGGTAIALVPGISQLRDISRSVKEGKRPAGFTRYKKNGLNPTSHTVLRKWFKDADLGVERIIDVLPQGAAKVGRATFGLLNGLLASEFVVVARKRGTLLIGQ